MAKNYNYSSRGKSSRKTGFRKSKLAVLLYLIVATAAVIAILEITNTIHIFHKSKPATEVVTQAGSIKPTPPSNVSSSNPTGAKSNSTANTLVQGGATDTNGQSKATTSPSQWITSKSGNITVKQPIANATVQSGDTLVGSAKLSQVTYRLIDDQLGVIATGTLNVAGGNFSAILHFGHKSATGRLDVFSTNSQGVELNEIQIAVRF